jgi:hypothetical protein
MSKNVTIPREELADIQSNVDYWKGRFYEAQAAKRSLIRMCSEAVKLRRKESGDE